MSAAVSPTSARQGGVLLWPLTLWLARASSSWQGCIRKARTRVRKKVDGGGKRESTGRLQELANACAWRSLRDFPSQTPHLKNGETEAPRRK